MNKNNTRRNNFNRGPNALWLLALAIGLAVVYLLWYNSINKEVKDVSFTQLVTAVETDKVESIEIQDQHVQGKFKDGKKFDGYVVPTDTFWKTLKEHNVDVVVFPPEKHSWGAYLFIPFILFLMVFLFMYLRQNQSGGSGSSKIFNVGKSKAKFFSPNTISVTFKDVAGVPDVKEDLKDVIEFLKSPEKFERLGAKVPRGILLTGAPGNGKTLLAKAVAGEASCPFFSISGSDFVEVFVGVGASRVRDLFAQARRHAPCIVFIDEIDAVGRQRGIGLGGGNDEREQTLNQLLAEMDGFSTEPGAIMVLAATNRPDVLDKALLRPGRFDRIIEVPYPDLACREEILKVHARDVKIDKAVDLRKIAQGTPGFSGADLENLINEAALLASKNNEALVYLKNFEAARDKILLGAERKTLVLTEKEKMLTAYHEAGHTLLRVLFPDADPVHKVTIIPRGRTLGVSWSMPEYERHTQSKSEILAYITICYGGLIAEKMILNDQTSGAANDIVQATKIARAMVCRYGMSDDLGPVDYDYTQEHPYLGRDIQNHKDYSEATAQKIDTQVEKIIQSCYENGETMLKDNLDKLHTLAKALLEKETLMANEIYEVLGMPNRESNSWREQ